MTALSPEPIAPVTLPAYTAGGQVLPDAGLLIADATFTSRFWAKVRIVPLSPCECWLWIRAKEEKGYGAFKVQGLVCRAHRVAYMLSAGYWPRSDRMILHSCDNPSCCNPDHLREGTATDNNQETVAKGRNRYGSMGTAHWRGGNPSENILCGSSKLGESDVREIRKAACAGVTITDLAAKYNVSKSTIRDCVRRRTFAWVVGS